MEAPAMGSCAAFVLAKLHEVDGTAHQRERDGDLVVRVVADVDLRPGPFTPVRLCTRTWNSLAASARLSAATFRGIPRCRGQIWGQCACLSVSWRMPRSTVGLFIQPELLPTS